MNAYCSWIVIDVVVLNSYLCDCPSRGVLSGWHFTPATSYILIHGLWKVEHKWHDSWTRGVCVFGVWRARLDGLVVIDCWQFTRVNFFFPHCSWAYQQCFPSEERCNPHKEKFLMLCQCIDYVNGSACACMYLFSRHFYLKSWYAFKILNNSCVLWEANPLIKSMALIFWSPGHITCFILYIY